MKGRAWDFCESSGVSVKRWWVGGGGGGESESMPYHRKDRFGGLNGRDDLLGSDDVVDDGALLGGAESEGLRRGEGRAEGSGGGGSGENDSDRKFHYLYSGTS